MAATLLQLSVFAVTIIQLTSSQPTVINNCYRQHNETSTLPIVINNCYPQHTDDNDDSSCERIEGMLSEMQANISQLVAAVAQIQANMTCQPDFEKPPNNVTDCLAASFTYIASVKGCYRPVTDNLDWDSAGLKCRSLHKDAHLLVINNAAEQAAVAEMLNSLNHSILTGVTGRLGGIRYWTAGQRIDPTRETPFIWKVTLPDQYDYNMVSLMTYTNWREGQPDYYGQAESCMHLLASYSYIWNDVPCSSRYYSVCELDM